MERQPELIGWREIGDAHCWVLQDTWGSNVAYVSPSQAGKYRVELGYEPAVIAFDTLEEAKIYCEVTVKLCGY